jgi:hypothetical protein
VTALSVVSPVWTDDAVCATRHGAALGTTAPPPARGLGPVPSLPPASRRLARVLAASSGSSGYARCGDVLRPGGWEEPPPSCAPSCAPPCDPGAPPRRGLGEHRTPRRPPCGRTTGNPGQALADTASSARISLSAAGPPAWNRLLRSPLEWRTGNEGGTAVGRGGVRHGGCGGGRKRVVGRARRGPGCTRARAGSYRRAGARDAPWRRWTRSDMTGRSRPSNTLNSARGVYALAAPGQACAQACSGCALARSRPRKSR